jgi:competence protein ComEA
VKYTIRKDGFPLKDWMDEHKWYIISALVLTIGGFYYLFVNGNEDSIREVETILPQKVNEEENEEPKTDALEKIIVDVKGQVVKPGVYPSSQGERVIDVIHRAGGLTENADESRVNFAEHVQDAMVIYIPAKGEEGVMAGGSQTVFTGTDGGSGQQGKVNLNKADETELQTLPGVGPAKAAAIIEYRETSGPFKTNEDLKNISGIGDKTFEKLKDQIVVQ